MSYIKRVFLIVLDSFGIGKAPDAVLYGDEGSDTLLSVSRSKEFSCPKLSALGLFNIDGVKLLPKEKNPAASFARMTEQSKGKDTTVGHWEIAGYVSNEALPVYPNGFPEDIMNEFKKATGREVLCNKPYSGTEVIHDYGREHQKTGALIVYTSQDSVFQIAAHKNVVPLEELYRCCRIARSLLSGKNSVGRVIARPFIGEYPNFVRTSERHDYSLECPGETVLDILYKNRFDILAMGKISDIFAARSVTKSISTSGNEDGMKKLCELAKEDFRGLCFINFSDFDVLYGHRNNIDGYARAISDFDIGLSRFLKGVTKDDAVIITADHGCDPATPSTDHSRENTPMLIFGDKIKSGVNLGTRRSFSDIGKTIAALFCLENSLNGESFTDEVLK